MDSLGFTLKWSIPSKHRHSFVTLVLSAEAKMGLDSLFHLTLGLSVKSYCLVRSQAAFRLYEHPGV